MKPTHASTCDKPGCSKARPRCAYHRQLNGKWKVCNCCAYHFPHRAGSGCYVHSPDVDRKQWERNTGTSWITGEKLA